MQRSTTLFRKVKHAQGFYRDPHKYLCSILPGRIEVSPWRVCVSIIARCFQQMMFQLSCLTRSSASLKNYFLPTQSVRVAAKLQVTLEWFFGLVGSGIGTPPTSKPPNH